MSTIPVIQPSFAAGELSPFLHGRVDLAKFHTGARTMRNFFVHPHGGASNRPGTRFVGPVGEHGHRHRLIPFRFRAAPGGQNYALVFGHHTMQVAMLNPAIGTPGFVESTPGGVFTLVTPYAAADLPTLKFVQSADTMTLTHPSYAPRRLTRSGHAAWQLTAITFAPVTPAPTGLTAGSPGSATSLAVTAINDTTGEESLPSASAGSASASDSWSWSPVVGCSTYNVYKLKGSILGFIAQVSGQGVATPAFTDSNIAPDIGNTPPQQRNPFGHGIATGATVVTGGAGYVAPTGALRDGGSVLSAVSFTVSGGAIVAASLASPGKKASANAYITVSDGSGAGAVLQPQWSDAGDGYGSFISGVTVVAGGAGYHAGAQVHSLYASSIVDYGGYVFSPVVSGGAIVSVSVTRGEGSWSPSEQAQLSLTVADSTGNGAVVTPVLGETASANPGCSTYFHQRQVFAASTDQPQTAWFSVAGAFNNMSVSQPTRDDDAITRTLVSREVNEIRHLVPGSSLLMMTSGAEWRCWPGPAGAALTPASCLTLPQSTFGCSHVPPIVAANSVLFVQERGSRVRELRFDVLQDQYQSNDMSVLAQHLLFDTGAQYTIEEWAFAEEPFRIVWAVRSDGALLGFTFMREHEVYAWHQHATDGAVESVCSIPETEGGVLLDAVYLIVRRTIGNQTRRYLERLAPRTFATIADAWFLDCALKYEGSPVSVVSGLGHLEGKQVMALADGSVIGPLTVAGGAVTLDGAYSKVIVGMPYTAEIETLNLELPGRTVQGQMKKIAKVTVRAKESRGVKVGISQNVAQEVKQRTTEALGTTPQPFTGDWTVTIPSEWNTDGRLFVRQDYPLPVTILDLIPEVAVGR